MFIYSVRASSVRFFGFIAIVLVLLFGAVSVLDGGTVYASSDSSVSYDGMSTDEARLAFIRQFGLEVDESSMTSEAFTMPDSFDRVILGYNELQKRQGLDLSKYAKKTRHAIHLARHELQLRRRGVCKSLHLPREGGCLRRIECGSHGLRFASDRGGSVDAEIKNAVFLTRVAPFFKKQRATEKFPSPSYCLFYCGSVVAAAAENENNGKNDDPGAVVVKDVA